MVILNQPFQGQLGDLLLQELSKDYKTVTIFSAFAKNSGVLRLKKSLEHVKQAGGTIRAFIGCDLDGTSYEALLNLFLICDELYVIHSENASATYHSKIYLLENKQKAWCAIGSNNLTGGGLWTNFESCAIQQFRLPEERAELQNIYAVVEKYMDPQFSCSMKILSVTDLDLLLNGKYLFREVEQKMNRLMHKTEHSKGQKKALFGTEKVKIPTLVGIEKGSDRRRREEAVEWSPLGGFTAEVDPGEPAPAFSNEQFWFEMRESTGGSRNILDLSKLGRIMGGSVKGTAYEYKDPAWMYGGVKFFDIDPEDTGREKNITINYLGKDYYPSTIKFASNNGSWRIQLKGEPSDGSGELSKFGSRGDFVHKILVFEKISEEYFVLSLLEETELNRLKKLSRVWASNGSRVSSKAYGML